MPDNARHRASWRVEQYVAALNHRPDLAGAGALEETAEVGHRERAMSGNVDGAKKRDVGGHRPRQNVAIGFSGNPVPPSIGTGAAVSRNSQRFRRDATCATASRSITSMSGSPIATIASW